MTWEWKKMSKEKFAREFTNLVNFSSDICDYRFHFKENSILQFPFLSGKEIARRQPKGKLSIWLWHRISSKQKLSKMGNCRVDKCSNKEKCQKQRVCPFFVGKLAQTQHNRQAFPDKNQNFSPSPEKAPKKGTQKQPLQEMGFRSSETQIQLVFPPHTMAIWEKWDFMAYFGPLAVARVLIL